jgi:hypothetical protein
MLRHAISASRTAGFSRRRSGRQMVRTVEQTTPDQAIHNGAKRTG